MSDNLVELHFQVIRQHIAVLQGRNAAAWREIDEVLEDLHVMYEQMQADLEAYEVAEADLHHYRDLFQFFPVASLVIDVNGLILEANRAAAQLLNVSYSYPVGKSLAGFVAEGDRAALRTHLNQLSQSPDLQTWRMSLCSQNGAPIAVALQVAAVRTVEGLIEQIRIGVYNLSQLQEMTAPASTPASLQQHLDGVAPGEGLSGPPLPQALDGLRVLVVDDETDVREFLTAVLEAHGIGVRAVASAAAALETLEQFHPDVLVSDIRMAGGDGYSLIRQVRALEAKRGGHIPAAAITAYLDEDREKALTAGFEAHLHKLAQPSELIDLVAQLAGRRRAL